MGILSVKYSEKACGRSSESKEDGTGVEFFLPRMVSKFWNSSVHVLLACILEGEEAVFASPTESVTSRLMLLQICLCTVSLTLSQHLSAVRHSSFGLQNCREILLNQGVGSC